MNIAGPPPTGGFDKNAFAAVALCGGAPVSVLAFLFCWAAVSIEAAYISGCSVYVTGVLLGGIWGCLAPRRNARSRAKGTRDG